MTDASVAAAQGFGQWADDDVTSVTRTNAVDLSRTTATNGGRYNPPLGLPNKGFIGYGIDVPLPISVTPSGHKALLSAEAEDDDDLRCQHEIGVVRGRLECLNCGQGVMTGRGAYVNREKRS